MPITYSKLIPEQPAPIYKYAAEDAGTRISTFFLHSRVVVAFCSIRQEERRTVTFIKTLNCFALSASLPGRATAHQLVSAIRQKCSTEEVLSILSELPNTENENDMVEMTYNPLKIDVFVQTLLNLGSKSFSHSFAAIAKFHHVFKVSIN